jgi:hypothetical protein
MKVRLDEVSLALLGEEDIQDSIAPIRANQMNYSISVEELCYARDISILPNIQESLQGRYLQFCLQYFAFFALDIIDLDSDLLASAIQGETSLKLSKKDTYNNALALCFGKTSSSSASLSSPPSRKHLRSASSISSSLQRA